MDELLRGVVIGASIPLGIQLLIELFKTLRAYVQAQEETKRARETRLHEVFSAFWKEWTSMARGLGNMYADEQAARLLKGLVAVAPARVREAARMVLESETLREQHTGVQHALAEAMATELHGTSDGWLRALFSAPFRRGR